MIGTIPTQPEEFDQALVKAELLRVQTLLPKLEAFDDREFRELPKKLQDEVHEIQTIIQPTMSGIEKVSGIIWQLWNSRTLCEKITNEQSAESFVRTFIPDSKLPELATSESGAPSYTKEEPAEEAPTPIEPVQEAPAAPVATAKSPTLSLSASDREDQSKKPASGGSTFTIS